MPANSELQQRLGSIEELLRKVDSAADPSLRATVQELVELVMSLNGAAFERMLELARANSCEGLVDKIGADEITGNVLVLYGLHPVKFEERVERALDRVRAQKRLENGEVEVIGIQEGVIRLRLHSAGQGCSGQSLKEAIEESLYRTAPDLTALTIENAEEKQSFVPVEVLRDGALKMAGKGGL